MATLDASIWLLVKEKAAPLDIFDKYARVYLVQDRSRFAWLLFYFAAQASHTDLLREMLVPNTQLKNKLGIREDGYPLASLDIATAMNEAVRKQNLDVLDVMLSVHPGIVSERGHIYVQNPRIKFANCPIELAVMDDHLEVLQVLMRHYTGQLMGNDNRHPLHFAASSKSPRCLEYLLSLDECRGQINLRDLDGWTPLLLAAMYQPELLPVLLRHGADVFATQGQEAQDALQILCNGCITRRALRSEEVDPCPTLQSTGRPRSMVTADDLLYIAPNIVDLAKLLMERGVNVNGERPPLRIFCKNIRRKLHDLLGDAITSRLYKEAIEFFASVSNQTILDSSLMLLCHQLHFLCSQLRRSNDYDNIVRHIDMMEFVRDCIVIVLEKGANPNTSEPAEEGAKRIRALQYLIPYTLPCAGQLKEILTRECGLASPQVPANQNSPLDIILVTLLVLFPLQIEEPEMHERGIITLRDIFRLLCRLGSKIKQQNQLFFALCIDPSKHGPFLDTYLESQSQSEHHSIVEHLLVLSEHEVFSEIQKQLSSSLVHMFSLKELLRKDIVQLLGSTKCPEKVHSLPIPETLKTYLMSFWEVKLGSYIPISIKGS